MSWYLKCIPYDLSVFLREKKTSTQTGYWECLLPLLIYVNVKITISAADYKVLVHLINCFSFVNDDLKELMLLNISFQIKGKYNLNTIKKNNLIKI